MASFDNSLFVIPTIRYYITLKREALRFSETFVSYCNITWHNISKDLNLNLSYTSCFPICATCPDHISLVMLKTTNLLKY